MIYFFPPLFSFNTTKMDATASDVLSTPALTSAEAKQKLLSLIKPVDLTKDGSGKMLLIKELEAKPQSDARDCIIRIARYGWYAGLCDRYDSPELQLVSHLKQAGFEDMAKRALYGEYYHMH